VASATPLPRQAAVEAASVVVAEAVVVSDVIPKPFHFSIAFVFAYNRG